MNTTEIDLTHFDVRTIPCRVKHAQIIQRWQELPVGQHFVLINDHDPVPLYYQFATIFPGQFTWEHLIAGPDVFHVKITRVAAAKKTAGPEPVSGGCGEQAQDGEVDARGLEPPQPMMAILAAVETLPANEEEQADRPARAGDGVSPILITSNDFAGAWAISADGQPMLPLTPGEPRQREFAYRVGVNIVMYVLTGNYKADQVHIPALLERLGQ